MRPMRLDIRKIREMSARDFHDARMTYGGKIPYEGRKIEPDRRGKEHPVQRMVQKVRETFIEMGFDEVENLYIITEDDVFKQYGPEAPVILDRCYYLAGLPRPDIGISEETVKELRKIKEDIDIEGLKSILREYREGKIEGDDIIEIFMEKLGMDNACAVRLVDALRDFMLSSPIPTKNILRSHMTSSWFHTLSSLQHRMKQPVCLFSVGPRFRREQRLDATHLRAHYGASAVILDEEISLKEGMRICEEILKRIGFKKVHFRKKTASANYYAPDMEYEVFADDVEIADCGMYSPIALARYSIEYPVFNVGFGIERIVMVMEGVDDVRLLMYPQFYRYGEMSNEDIAEGIHLLREPRTSTGKKVASAIVRTCEKFADREGACRFLAWEGKIHGKNIRVSVEEREENVPLCGPAAFNYIVVYNGNIYGVPKTENYKEYFDKGKVLFRYIDAIAQYAASVFESMDKEREEIAVKVAKLPSHINIGIDEHVRYAITRNRKKMDIRGPVFVRIVAEMTE